MTSTLAFIGGLPGGVEVLFLLLLFVLAPIYVVYRVIKWAKGVTESAAGMD